MFKKAVLLIAMYCLSFAALAGEVVDVSIKKFKFIPEEITVKKGTKIRWTNNEKRQYHSVWFEERGDQEPDYFFPEEFFELEFNEAGTFPYRCGPHPKMLGTVIVTE